MDSSIISIIIVLITMGLFVWNRLPISVVAILGSVAMAMFIPEMELSAVYSGFSATGWPMVVGMCVVSAALFETGIARKIGEKIGNSFLAKTERRFIVTVSAVCSLMSAFMSNNGTVAIWMPIIAIVAANSCGKIRSKMVIFPAGTAAVIGGACSLIGSTSQLAANSVLQGYAGYEEGMGMFDMTKIMFPAAVVQIIFWGTIGYKLLDKVLKPNSPDFDKGNMYSVAEIHKLEKEQESDAPAWKGYVALGTMILCIVLFVLSGFQPFKSYFNIGTIGLIGAAMVLGTGCISIKKAYSDLPWDVFVCIGTISGIGTGLDVSGGGALIANAVLNLFGGKNASVVLLTVVIAVLTSVLTNIMSNNATAAMLTPICIAIALSLGISPIPWVIVIGACSNLAIATYVELVLSAFLVFVIAILIIKLVGQCFFDIWHDKLELEYYMEYAMSIAIGVEFVKMLCTHQPGTIIEVLLFATARQMIVEPLNVYETLVGIGAIAALFAIRKFLFCSFDEADHMICRGSQTVAHANLITGAKIPEEKTRILRNIISDKLSEEGKTVAIGACVYYKDCALRVDSMREGMVTRVEVIKNL